MEKAQVIQMELNRIEVTPILSYTKVIIKVIPNRKTQPKPQKLLVSLQ